MRSWKGLMCVPTETAACETYQAWGWCWGASCALLAWADAEGDRMQRGRTSPQQWRASGGSRRLLGDV